MCCDNYDFFSSLSETKLQETNEAIEKQFIIKAKGKNFVKTYEFYHTILFSAENLTSDMLHYLEKIELQQQILAHMITTGCSYIENYKLVYGLKILISAMRDYAIEKKNLKHNVSSIIF